MMGCRGCWRYTWTGVEFNVELWQVVMIAVALADMALVMLARRLDERRERR